MLLVSKESVIERVCSEISQKSKFISCFQIRVMSKNKGKECHLMLFGSEVGLQGRVNEPQLKK